MSVENRTIKRMLSRKGKIWDANAVAAFLKPASNLLWVMEALSTTVAIGSDAPKRRFAITTLGRKGRQVTGTDGLAT
jgi:hypothetical protein